MAANAIGSGSIILTANADQMAAGLDKAAAKVDAFGTRAQLAAAKVHTTAERAAKVPLGQALGGFGEVVSGFGAVGIGAGLGLAVAKMVEFAAMTDRAKEKLAEAGKEALKLGESLNKVLLANVEAKLPRDFDASNLEQVGKSRALARQQVEDATRAVDRLDKQFRALDANHGPAGELFRKVFNGLGGEYKLDQTKRRLDQAKAEKELALSGLAEIDRAIEADRNRRETDYAKAIADQVKPIDDLTQALREQTATFGMGAEAAKIFLAEQEGVARATTEAAKARLQLRDAKLLEKEVAETLSAPGPAFDFGGPKLGGALTKGSAEAFRAVVRHQMAGIAESSDTGKSILGAQKEGNRIGREIVDAVKGITLEAI